MGTNQMSENEIEADPRDKWTAFHFSLSNPTGVDQGDVASCSDPPLTTSIRSAMCKLRPHL